MFRVLHLSLSVSVFYLYICDDLYKTTMSHTRFYRELPVFFFLHNRNMLLLRSESYVFVIHNNQIGKYCL